jgi:molybdopterin synthase catalytic subunit
MIADSIAKHSKKLQVGAHDIFLGQVRADASGDKIVSAIEYSAYKPMAEAVLACIREEAIIQFTLTCAHIYHSLGTVDAGGISLFVFTSAPHRKATLDATRYVVERIKKEVPVFGKELWQDGSFTWKTNTP